MQLESATDGESGAKMGGHFYIFSKVPMKLNQGEALITFEEEKGKVDVLIHVLLFLMSIIQP